MTLEDISITVIHLSPQDLRQELEAENKKRAKRRRELYAETRLEIVAMEETMTIMYKLNIKRSKLSLSDRQEILDKAETRW